MAHITIELHERYFHEHIEEREYAVIREECATRGFHNTASWDGVAKHLTRACYFSQTGTVEMFQDICARIKSRLGREVSAVFSAGNTYEFGLKVASPSTLLTDRDWEKPIWPKPTLLGPAPRGPLTNALYAATGKPQPTSNLALLGKIGKL